MTPEQLFNKYGSFDGAVNYDGFIKALKEYGKSVRKQAVSVCKTTGQNMPLSEQCACYDCAAAIEKMEIK